MKDIAIIDIEPSGLDFDFYPIEVAARVNGEIKILAYTPRTLLDLLV